MPQRTRNYSIPGPASGTYRRFDSQTNTVETHLGYAAYGDRGSMTDTSSGLGKENDLESTQMSITGGVVNGTYQTPGSRYRHVYDGFVTQAGSAFATVPVSEWTGSIRSYISALADSHPGEPPVSIPNFLFELKDIPDMLMHAGKKAKALEDLAKKKGSKNIYEHLYSPKAVAEDWLNYNFGWRPFVSDLKDISNLSSWSQDRLQFLSKRTFVKTGGDLGTRIGRGTNNYTYPAGRLSFNTKRDLIDTTHEWFVGHWRVNTPTLQAIQSNQLVQIGHMLNLGSPIDLIYNAMPWSWMVDWFADVGSVIKVNSNKFGVSLVAGNHMINHIQKIKINRIESGDGLFLSPAEQIIEEKRRISGLPSILDAPNKYFNFFSASRLATLAALSVTKGKLASSF